MNSTLNTTRIRIYDIIVDKVSMATSNATWYTTWSATRNETWDATNDAINDATWDTTGSIIQESIDDFLKDI